MSSTTGSRRAGSSSRCPAPSPRRGASPAATSSVTPAPPPSITACALARLGAPLATLRPMRDLTNRALDTATALGASYADVRVIRRIEESINIKSTRVEGVQSGETEGFGVRVLVDGAWGFAASHHLSTAEADRVAAEAVRIAKASATALRTPSCSTTAAGQRPVRDARRGGPVRGPARSQDRRPPGRRPRDERGQGHRVHGEPLLRPARVEDLRRERRQLHRAGHHPHRRGPRGQRDRGRRAPAPQLPRQRRAVGVRRLRVRARHGPRGATPSASRARPSSCSARRRCPRARARSCSTRASCTCRSTRAAATRPSSTGPSAPRPATPARAS